MSEIHLYTPVYKKERCHFLYLKHEQVFIILIVIDIENSALIELSRGGKDSMPILRECGLGHILNVRLTKLDKKL